MTDGEVGARSFRTYRDVQHQTGSQLLEQVVAQRTRLSERLSSIGTIVAVASGKGGVGKSLVSANLAITLASRGRSVAVLDADLNGPSLAKMLGVS
jgi:ATP-binding protein involved in chromosome partitioning